MKETKKKKREAIILKSFLKLSKIFSYKELSMNKIAEQCDMAVGTLYNYFPSKNAILIHIIEYQLNMILDSGKKILGIVNENPYEWMLALLNEHFKFCEIARKDVLINIISEIDGKPWEKEISQIVWKVSEKLQQQINELITHFKTSNQLNENIKVEEACQLIFNLFYIHFREFVYTENTMETSFNHLKNQIKIVFTGITPLVKYS